MFNLQQYSAKIAVITDRGEKLTYAELYTKVEDFHEHIPCLLYTSDAADE